jgi:cobalt-zinc-cadmium efflux system protein
MLAVACGGLLVNGAGFWFLRRGREGNLNVRGAWLHVLTDALGSIQAIVAGAVIWAFAWNWVDPVASVLIGLLVIYSSWSLLAQSVAVLMEGAPGNVKVDDVRAALLDLPDVSSVHDLHVWTITSGFVALSAHVTCADPAKRDVVLASAQRVLAERFGIQHSTIQVDRDPTCDSVAHATHDPPIRQSH